MRVFKEYKGITLIALIVTIVVLLILAGVTIASLTGSDSAPAKANESGQKNDIGAARDDVQLTAINALQDAYETVYVADTVSAGNAKISVGKKVIKALYDKYGDGTQLGNASIEVTVQGVASSLDNISGGTISIYTTDFEVIGTVELSGGTITWGEIEDNTPGIKIINIPTSVEINEEKTLSIKRKHVSENATVTWTSENPTVATINSTTGIVKGIAKGTTKITASIDDNGTTYTAECTIKVELGKADKINAAIGQIVTYPKANETSAGYSADYDGTWRVFYADPDYMYIISTTNTLNGYSLNGSNKAGKDKYSTGAASTIFTTGTYGATYNSKWLAKGTTDSNNRSKAVAYLCDPAEWSQYVSNNAPVGTFAVGGPTLELLIKSWNAAKTNNLTVTSAPTAEATWSSLDVSVGGYNDSKPSVLSVNYKEILTDIVPANINEKSYGLYNPTGVGNESYWLASPSSNNKDNVCIVFCYEGYVIGNSYNVTNRGIRPVVAIPISSVTISGSTVGIDGIE